MNELITVNYETERPTVSGRELYEALEVKTPYHIWFPRMCEYGFNEKKDFWTFLFESTGGRPSTDHQLTISMAKEICMLQRNEKGKQFRQYFIEVEEKWNTPEMVMKRALDFANKAVARLQQENAVQAQQIAELQPKASYYDVVLNSKDLTSTSTIAKDYGWSAKKLNSWLADMGVQFKLKSDNTWLLYQKYAQKGYTRTKTHTYISNNGEHHSAVASYWTQAGRLFIYDLMKTNGILPKIEKE